ncbi:hypothetical protein D3C71_1684070 [compost metagenome]
MLGIGSHLLKLFIGSIRRGQLDQLHLVKLMLTDQSAGIAAGRACFRTETGAVSDEILGQIGYVQNLLTVIVRYRNLSCWNQIIIRIAQLEQILFELRQLSCSVQAVFIDDIRRQHFFILVFAAMKVHHEVNQCSLQTGSETFVEDKA